MMYLQYLCKTSSYDKRCRPISEVTLCGVWFKPDLMMYLQYLYSYNLVIKVDLSRKSHCAAADISLNLRRIHNVRIKHPPMIKVGDLFWQSHSAASDMSIALWRIYIFGQNILYWETLRTYIESHIVRPLICVITYALATVTAQAPSLVALCGILSDLVFSLASAYALTVL